MRLSRTPTLRCVRCLSMTPLLEQNVKPYQIKLKTVPSARGDLPRGEYREVPPKAKSPKMLANLKPNPCLARLKSDLQSAPRAEPRATSALALDGSLTVGITPSLAAFITMGFSRLAELVHTDAYTLPLLRDLAVNNTAVKHAKFHQLWRDVTQQLKHAATVSHGLSTSVTTSPATNLADFILPDPSSCANLILSTYNNSFPSSLASHHNLPTQPAQLTHILQHLYYQYLVPAKIAQIPPRKLNIDILNPAEWFPEARKIRRKVIMHVGPTNSGKTYRALLRLERAATGYFAGPLRLLGREIYERMRAKGIRCNLITGEEIIPDLDRYGNPAGISSGTVEMIDLRNEMEVCVLDEIQMIADEYRGFAWTNAFLGVKAREIHLCGEASAVPLIKKLVEITGDALEINHYERLGKLEVSNRFVNIRSLMPGDAVIAFSKRGILELRQKIEEQTMYKCAVVYGALPPETRNAQSDGFNTGKYDILVASDAVGMGLNLKIKRIVFSAVDKFNGEEMEVVSPPQIKQIGGRAGRYRVAPVNRAPEGRSISGYGSAGSKFASISVPDAEAASLPKANLQISNRSVNLPADPPGVVTAFSHSQLKTVRTGMAAPIHYLTRASLWPSDPIFARYISEFPHSATFSQVLAAFQKDVKNSANYEISSLRPRMEIAIALEDITTRHAQPIMVSDVLKFATSPAKCSDKAAAEKELFQSFVRTVISGATTQILDYSNLPIDSLRVTQPTGNENVLTQLEIMHRAISLFLWFSYRYPNFFVDREGVTDLKHVCEKRIMEELACLKVIKRTQWKGKNGGSGSWAKKGDKPKSRPKGQRR
ncbi:hypothetical protein BABINDRAFT_158923 [Babjeviella inositovora NRRL Y-12698]|uniref:RNA helicase n=1 Tax=Babjeviella inositovora NRRL Y-12698 TaxID=984486 RepID=A0A1E3QXB6_9ASCO|nr:uncharacterized protein BABINDRAFT_158923 [Babjeviella inositovora NRRL Y-12698]ODQ82300.1 hypothetical protein BABINDRAFT_158923 [Babjeviella inositovora NRRL Y-12698]